MSVKTGAQALEVLRARLDGPLDDGPVGFGLDTPSDTPPDAAEPAPSGLWGHAGARQAHGLADPRAYRIAQDVPSTTLHAAPFLVLESPEGTAEHGSHRDAYCRASADVTMRGGTTSGVVYPLAICELARRFRLRNIGGASAGAIAAAAAAAAELGRSEADHADPRPDASPITTVTSVATEHPAPGHVRPGYAGLSDVIRWLAELPSPPGGDAASTGETPGARATKRPEYRLAQLFVPSAGSRAVWRLMTAVQRHNFVRLPLFLLGALGWVAFTLNLIVLPAAAAFALTALAGLPVWAGWNVPGAGAALLGATLAVFGVIFTVALTWNALSRRRAWTRLPDYRRTTPRPSPRPKGRPLLAGLALIVGGAALLIWMLQLVGKQLAAPLWPVLASLVLLQFIVLASSVAALLSRVKTKARFGLISGSSTLISDPTGGSRLGRLWDRLCGLPHRTVDRALVTWLSDTLGELAGLEPGTVLRFGHLWAGAGYDVGSLAADRPDSAVRDPRRRRVNLELITTELVRGVPYRFPLDPRSHITQRHGQDVHLLYFDPADLSASGREVLPPHVVEAMKLGGTPECAYDVATNRPRKLYPLPSGGDLPVIFAARLSLSLPGVFEAVPLYRRVNQAIVRDELGRAVEPEKKFPPDEQLWVEQLWFSDGGITSNFPVHFFDAPLPLWPTFAINLGAHPPGFESQDVVLPQDWDGGNSTSNTLDGLTGFAGAIVNTARSWHDTTVSLMPAFRGRVATVRQRPTEGGTNFYMEPGTIASMALRGGLAGARLARRFDPGSPMRFWWQRHQWMRTRIAAHTLDDLRRTVAMAHRDPFLDALLNPGCCRAALGALVQAGRGDTAVALGDPELPYPDNWFDTPHDHQRRFWAGINEIAVLGGLAPLTTVDDEPHLLPAPQLRQVPPT